MLVTKWAFILMLFFNNDIIIVSNKYTFNEKSKINIFFQCNDDLQMMKLYYNYNGDVECFLSDEILYDKKMEEVYKQLTKNVYREHGILIR